MRTNHPFALWAPEFAALNEVDYLGRARCSDCGLPRGVHPTDEPDRSLDAEDLRRLTF